MKTMVYETPVAAACFAADTMQTLLAQKPDALLCLAAGHSSLPIFEELITREQAGKISFRHARVVGLDEWMGLGEAQDGSCAGFVRRHFLCHVRLPSENIRLFNGLAQDPTAECAAVEQFIVDCGGLDYLLLGLGMNGHLALNEPGSPHDAGARVVPLSETTQRVAHKYFTQGMPPLTQGVTLGLRNLLEARHIQLAVFGAGKAEIVSRLLAGPVTAELPASALCASANAELLLDTAAAG